MGSVMNRSHLGLQYREDVWKLIKNEQIEDKNLESFTFLLFTHFSCRNGFEWQNLKDFKPHLEYMEIEFRNGENPIGRLVELGLIDTPKYIQGEQLNKNLDRWFARASRYAWRQIINYELVKYNSQQTKSFRLPDQMIQKSQIPNNITNIYRSIKIRAFIIDQFEDDFPFTIGLAKFAGMMLEHFSDSSGFRWSNANHITEILTRDKPKPYMGPTTSEYLRLMIKNGWIGPIRCYLSVVKGGGYFTPAIDADWKDFIFTINNLNAECAEPKAECAEPKKEKIIENVAKTAEFPCILSPTIIYSNCEVEDEAKLKGDEMTKRTAEEKLSLFTELAEFLSIEKEKFEKTDIKGERAKIIDGIESQIEKIKDYKKVHPIAKTKDGHMTMANPLPNSGKGRPDRWFRFADGHFTTKIYYGNKDLFGGIIKVNKDWVGLEVFYRAVQKKVEAGEFDNDMVILNEESDARRAINRAQKLEEAKEAKEAKEAIKKQAAHELALKNQAHNPETGEVYDTK